MDASKDFDIICVKNRDERVRPDTFGQTLNYAWCEMVCSLTKTCGESADVCADLRIRSGINVGVDTQSDMSSLSDAHRRSTSHLDGDRSSSAGSSLGSCSPPPASSHSPPPPRPPWLHDFHAAASPHVLQFLNLSAAGGGMLGSQPLAALHSMAERSHQQQHHQQQSLQLSGVSAAQLANQPQGQPSPTGSGKQSPATSITSVGSNPHGIDTILSRPAAAHPQVPVSTSHGLPPAPHPQPLSAPRYSMHTGFTASSGTFQQPSDCGNATMCLLNDYRVTFLTIERRSQVLLDIKLRYNWVFVHLDF